MVIYACLSHLFFLFAGLFLHCSITITPDGTLIIQNISKSDEGKYTCFAENFMGKANSTGILSVRGKFFFLVESCSIIYQDLFLWPQGNVYNRRQAVTLVWQWAAWMELTMIDGDWQLPLGSL